MNVFFLLIKVCFIEHLKDYETQLGHNSCLTGLKCALCACEWDSHMLCTVGQAPKKEYIKKNE